MGSALQHHVIATCWRAVPGSSAAAGRNRCVHRPRTHGTPHGRAPCAAARPVPVTVQRGQRTDLHRRNTTQDVLRPKFSRVVQASGTQQFLQGMQRVLVVAVDTSSLVRRIQMLPARGILGSDPGRTLVGMAAQRLDAAQREHEASAGIAPVGPNAMVRAMSNALVILPAAPMRMRSRRSRPTRCCAPAAVPHASARRHDRRTRPVPRRCRLRRHPPR